MSGQRQLAMAWRLYTTDNAGRLPYAAENPYNPATRGATWVTGVMNFDPGNRSNWDPQADLLASPLARYGADAIKIWKCPTDDSWVTVNGRVLPRLRSRGMNLYLGGYGGEASVGMNNCRVFLKESDFLAPIPSMLMVLADVREDSIDSGSFGVNMTGYWPSSPDLYAFWDLPANYHNNGASFAFADGHSETKRWQHAQTTPALVRQGAVADTFNSPNNPDIGWLQERATRPVDDTRPTAGQRTACGGVYTPQK